MMNAVQRRYVLLACAAVAGALWMGAGLLAQDTTMQPAATEPAAEEPQGLPMVATDREVGDFLKQAEAAIGRGEFDKAVELLHTLIVSDKRAFVRLASEPRLAVSVRRAATSLLGTLPGKGLEPYARQFDGPAAKLLEEARRDGDTAKLRRVAEEFFQTRSGDQALNVLGALAFDRGDFVAAGQAWERIALEQHTGTVSRPLLWTKAAVAYHLAGDEGRATEALKQLKSRHAGAKVTIAGQEVDAAGYVQQALAMPVAAEGPRQGLTEWPLVYGSAPADAVGGPLEPGLFPLWSGPATGSEREALARRVIGLGAAEGDGLRVACEGGRVRVYVRPGGRAQHGFTLPALVHPIVAGERVICRTDAGVVAYELGTGKVAWQSAALPMFDTPAARGEASNPFIALAGDMGRYTLTAGAGNVYAVGRFRRIDPATYRRYGMDVSADSSTLVALSAATGQVIWEAGNGKGANETLKTAKFLSAPTYHDGRLFALVRAGSYYKALCLEAAGGALVWETTLGPIPTSTGEAGSWQAAYTTELLTERGTPPAVDQGRVYVTTNAGLVACLEAGRGEPVWAHRYDSTVSGAASEVYMQPVADRAYLLVSAQRPVRPQNPVIVTGGRVICLPSDSEMVLALGAEDGRPLWQRGREDQEDLSLVDGQRVLVSGPDMTIVRAATGELVKRLDLDLSGRPAITPEAIVAGGAGKLVRVGLGDLAVQETPVTEEQAALGTLIACRGNLIAATAGGVTCYFGFEKAWASLAERLEKAPAGAAKAAVRLTRGQFALASGKPAEAAGELRAAVTEAGADAAVKTRAQGWLYDALLKQAELPGADAAGLLGEADKVAATPVDHVTVAFRRLKVLEAAGKPAEAVAEAQELAAKYADVAVRGPDGELTTGRELGRREIARLIKAHGREAYAALEQQARTALEKAGGDVSALLAVAQQWPQAEVAPQALLAAGEKLYREASGKSPVDTAGLARAGRVLGRLRDYPDAPASAAGRAGECLVAARLDPKAAGLLLGELKTKQGEARVKFADFEGTVAELAETVARSGPAEAGEGVSELGGKLRAGLTLRDGAPVLLRDGRGRPVVVGARVFLLTTTGVECVNTEAGEPQAAVLWRTPLNGRADPRGRVGQLSGDGRRLALIDAQSLTVIDTLTGQPAWQKPLAELGVESWSRVGGAGEYLVFVGPRGRAMGVDFSQGAALWRGNLQEGPMEVRGDVILSRNAGWQRGFSLVGLRTGKPVPMPGGRIRSEPILTRDGLVAIGVNDMLNVFDPGHMERPALWSLAQARGQEGTFLAASSQHVLWRDDGDGSVRLLDLASSGKTTVLALPKGDGGPLTAQGAYLVGQRAYVLLGTPPGGGLEGMLTPTLAAFAVADGKLIWSKSLTAASLGPCQVSCVPYGAEMVAMALRPTGGQRAVLLAVRGDGEIVNCADGTAQGDPTVQAKPTVPVLLNGHVVMETPSGVQVLRGDL